MIEKRSKTRIEDQQLTGKTDLGTTWDRTRRKRGKTRIRADQKARRDNNLVIAGPDCKTSTPVQIRAAPPYRGGFLIDVR